LNSFLRHPLGRLWLRGGLEGLLVAELRSREGLDDLVVTELRFVALVCNFFSRLSIRCSKELILAFSCAIESSLQ
jgi:hypothetical protein